MQLVGGGVEMFDAMKQNRIDRDGVHAKFGVYPERVVDVQALAGDSVDNVPGAPGIGVKTAALLINEYGDLDSLLERAGEIKQPKRRETLINNAGQIRLSRQLVQLDCNTPLEDADKTCCRTFWQRHAANHGYHTFCNCGPICGRGCC
jgi:DNA polymerase-1